MNSSLKGTVAICLCLLFSDVASAQFFQRAKPVNQPVGTADLGKKATVSKKKPVAAVKKQRQKAASEPEATTAEVSTIDQVSYNTFDNTGTYAEAGLEGFETVEGTTGDYSFESCDCGPNESCPLDGCNSGCCGCLDGCGPRLGLLDRPGQFFFVADYIYARASFSEALAYVITDSNNPQNGAEFVEFDFDYESSYRFSGGYRFCDCGGEIVFNHARYRSEGSFQVVDGGPNISIQSPYEIQPRQDGGFLQGVADVDLDSYDIAISKTIPLGSPLGCCDCCCDTCCGDTCCQDSCCGDACCGDCCGGWCPAWDITWSAGIRFADVDWSRSTFAFDNGATNPFEGSDTRLSFEGVGARVGVLGRRYFGCRGWLSAYAKGDISLLVGDMDIQTNVFDFESSVPITQNVISHRNNGRRVIPVTEIEAGLTAHLGRHVHLSSGYFIAAWHDLGMRDTYDFAAAGGAGGFQLSHYDDANILGFDGFFARAEVTY